MSKKKKIIRKVWPFWMVVFILVTIGMGVSVFYSIRGEEKSDYVVQTNAFFAPFEYYEGREIVGVDVEIVNRVAEKLEKSIRIENVEFDVIIDNVETGRIADAGAAGLTITPARAEKVDFTIPYYTSVQYILYNREEPLPLRNGHVIWNQLAGATLGSQTGSTGYLFADAEISEGVLKDTGAVIKGLESHQLAADAILSHLIDYAIIDELAANFIVEKNPGLASAPLYVRGTTMEEDAPVAESYAIAVNRDRPELLAAFNEVLEEMMMRDPKGISEMDRLIIKYMKLSEEE
ncbi:MAG: transporter substrate-binding domain-containing protein [Candidatus Saccharibacteria bacterium]|nr:transporter substrate-binding domain-containing protein [Candidatus Saccharibacteria bacterium]